LRSALGWNGARILVALVATVISAITFGLIRSFGKMLATLRIAPKVARILSDLASPVRRFASRTTLLETALDNHLFKGRTLNDLPSHPNLVVNATELRTGASFRFGIKESGSWRWGRVRFNSIPLAHAVASSAAYPMFLPAFDEYFEFDRNGVVEMSRVLLTDGGVYDNLGVTCFWPDRSSAISLNVQKVDMILCCSAGYGLKNENPSQFFLARLISALGATFDRAQNASIQRLHDLKANGKITGFVFPYLGQQDKQLPNPPIDLVAREDAHIYPTNFNAMPADWIDRLSKRGEQLTICLVNAYHPELIEQIDVVS